MIRLGNCLDLLDPRNTVALRTFQIQLTQTALAEERRIPANQRTRKYFDHYVFESYFKFLETEQGERIDSVRGVFVSPQLDDGSANDGGRPLWDGTWLRENAHVQICVRPHAIESCILGTWPVLAPT